MAGKEARFLKVLMDLLPEGIFSMDMEGRILLVNRSLTELLGYRSFSLLGKSVFDFAPQKARKGLREVLNEITASGVVRDRVVQLYDAMGRVRDLKMSLSLLKDGMGRPLGVIAVVSDVGDATRLERELEELQQFSQDVLDSAGVGIIATDLKGNIVFASRGAEPIFNTPAQELVGQNIIKRSPDPLVLNERFEGLISSGEPFEYGFEVMGEDGMRSLVAVYTLLRGRDGAPAGAIAVFEDVTRIKEIEEELKKSNSVLREYTRDLEGLVEMTRTIGSYLDEENIYRGMVEAARKILNVEVSCFFRYDEGGRRLSLASIGGFRLRATEALDRELEKGGLYGFLRTLRSPRIVHRLSEERHFKLPGRFRKRGLQTAVFVPVRIKDRALGVLSVFLKSPERFKKEEVEILQGIGTSAAIAVENARLYEEVKEYASGLEEKVRERTAELEQSNRLKDLFIDIMGHDLLKPAGIARLSAEMLLDGEEDEMKKRIIGSIVQSNKRIIDLIESATILAKLESGQELELSPGDVMEIVRDAAADAGDLAQEKGVEIQIEGEGSFPASVNPLIYDVFSNLITNAIKYGPENSQVKVAIEDAGGDWKVSVADRGPGIPDEHKGAVFERFKRLEKGAVKGSGLGLAIVKKVVEIHRGRVWVEDNPGGGSIFCVTIPKAA
ncbi:MAG: PAS domain-containing sensor histidine kinase [Methanobacteriota archaeon]|nr:MAG: PAS domain-containing sensor histidine kinase [Euryarchaeota archaeon]